MKDTPANNRIARDTQRRDWSAAEKAMLKAIAPKAPRCDQLRDMFPGRSLSAIKLKLYQTRRELELPKRGRTANLRPKETRYTILDKDTPADPTPSWQEARRPALEKSSAQLLAALQAAA